jgi:hypothetical protein
MRREREGAQIPCSADGRTVGRLPLRSLRRRESGGTFDLCPRLVDSRVGLPVGAGRVVVLAAVWNKVAGVSSPLRRCLVWRSREASGGRCPQIRRSGGSWCSGHGLRGGGGGHPFELLSLGLVFVTAWWLLALLRRLWGCGGLLAGVAVRRYCLCRSGLRSCGSSPAITSKKTVPSSSTRRACVAPVLEDFRLLALAKLPGAMKTAACLQCAVWAAAAVFSQVFHVSFLFDGDVCTGVFP